LFSEGKKGGILPETVIESAIALRLRKDSVQSRGRARLEQEAPGEEKGGPVCAKKRNTARPKKGGGVHHLLVGGKKGVVIPASGTQENVCRRRRGEEK